MSIQKIRSWRTGEPLYEGDHETFAKAVVEAVASGANLSYANLRDADLSYANLPDANLSYANLSYANLPDANLRGANLRYANLSYANLRGANLRYAEYRGRKWNRAPLIKTATGAPWLFGEDGEQGKYWIGCKCKTLDEWEAYFTNPDYNGSVNETWRKLYTIELRAMDEQVKILDAVVSVQKGVAV